MNEAARSFYPMLERVLGKQTTIDVELEPNLWPTRVDGAQLEQVLINLAVNARDAMPEGGRLRFVTRSITLAESAPLVGPELPAGGYLAVDVIDTGVGIDRALKDRIFEPFFTTKPVGQGTGLGLAMCFGIVKQAGGHVGVVSSSGEGSRFTVLLPRVQAVVQLAGHNRLSQLDPSPRIRQRPCH